jgi:23S rRNA (cytosine1962-C5)-methyltransferase
MPSSHKSAEPGNDRKATGPATSKPSGPAGARTDTAVVSVRGAERIRSGHPWVYREDLLRAPESGDVVRVEDKRGQDLGAAIYSPLATAPIALRMLGRDAVALDEALYAERIGAALAGRQALFGPLGLDAFRVVHGEADRLPGLFIDRYGDVAVIQTACAAMDSREALIADVLMRRFGFRLVVARDDGGARDFEALPRRRGVLAGGGDTRVAFHDAGSAMEADVLVDGKTGSFLDQQENHARAGEYARSLVASRPAPVLALDTFSYHGGFALSLARAGARTLAFDESSPAVDRLRENVRRNGADVEARCENAFDVLRRFDGERRSFDIVVVDPPALAKRKSALPAAERGYKELNLRALRLVRSGGILVTCSCSGKMTADRFGAMVEGAARDVGRTVQLLERRGAGRDHPTLIGVPETEYLKTWFLRVLD